MVCCFYIPNGIQLKNEYFLQNRYINCVLCETLCEPCGKNKISNKVIVIVFIFSY